MVSQVPTKKNLSPKEKKFVELYCDYKENDGIRAAYEVTKTRTSNIQFLTRPHVLAAIEAAGGPKPVISVRYLTPEEHKFLDLYLECLDPTVVAEKMGIPKTTAHKWLSRPHVRVELQKRLTEIADKSIIRSEEVIEELALIAFSDIKDYCTFSGSEIQLKDSEDIINTAAISELSEGKHGVKLKLHNKITALENLGKYLGLWREKIELTGKDGEPIKIENPLDSLNDKLDKIASNNKKTQTEYKDENINDNEEL